MSTVDMNGVVRGENSRKLPERNRAFKRSYECQRKVTDEGQLILDELPRRPYPFGVNDIRKPPAGCGHAVDMEAASCCCCFCAGAR